MPVTGPRAARNYPSEPDVNASNGPNMSQWHIDSRTVAPVLIGTALAAMLLALLLATTSPREHARLESARLTPAPAADELRVCVTQSGFCPLGATAPEGQPCHCADPWRGAVAGQAWSLRAILRNPSLLPERLDDVDPDE